MGLFALWALWPWGWHLRLATATAWTTKLDWYGMARNRIIKPEFWADAKVGRLSFGARLLYIATWNFADDYGTISASPRRLLGDAFENDESVQIGDVIGWLAEIEAQGMIRKYTADEKEWYEITDFFGRPCPDAWNKLRIVVFKRDNYTCQYCGKRGGYLECDHIIPVTRGGSHEIDNLATACRKCNRSKRNKLVNEWRAE